jgi:hypothetical protein
MSIKLLSKKQTMEFLAQMMQTLAEETKFATIHTNTCAG